MKLILASKSPRRKEILENLGVKFQIITLDTDESTNESSPEKFVSDVARKKGEAVRDMLLHEDRLCSNTVILSCDTIVVSPDGEIMGKPHSPEDAKRMIQSFSGKAHTVISGIALITRERTVTAYERSLVYFDTVPEREIDAYILTDEAYDKAGAYAVQGTASLWINKIDGDYFNIVGLPVKRVSDLVKTELGIDIRYFE